MKRERWFLPETPDVVGLLRDQIAVTSRAWTRSPPGRRATRRSRHVRDREHRADTAKREVRLALQAAFVTPLEPEDVFVLSRGVDWLLNHAKDTINESEDMACPPDAALAEMTALLAQALRHIDEAIGQLGSKDGDAIVPADAAIKAERRLERAYRAGMAALLESDDLRDVTARRELYRRCSRMGEGAVDVAERVVYVVVKES